MKRLAVDTILYRIYSEQNKFSNLWYLIKYDQYYQI
jgi:hypothetical protein